MNYKLITLRELVGEYLVKASENRNDIYVLDSDLAKSTTTDKFEVKYQKNFIETGIAEQNAMSIACGIASEGMIPFVVNFAIFLSGTSWTQLRQICYANQNVKLIATHPGMDGGFDGATHHALEDIALMRAIPNLTVLTPSSPQELAQCIDLAINTYGPFYIRCSRDSVINFEHELTPTIGKALVYEDEGDDFAIIYEGSSALISKTAFDQLNEKGLKGKLINIFSVKPLDKAKIIEIAKSVKKIITVENHTYIGGIGSAVSEVLSSLPEHAPVHMVATQDTFTESGPSSVLKQKYGVSVDKILEYAKS